MECNTFSKPEDDIKECNICYEDPYDISLSFVLDCCNRSKRICMSCINCLTTPICPYCRHELPQQCIPYLNEKTNNVSTSEPLPILSWEHFIQEESSINPYLYEDSRRLRRQIRRLRHEYLQRVSTINRQHGWGESSRRNNRRRRNHNDRQVLRSFSRNMTHLYQENPHDEMFSMEI